MNELMEQIYAYMNSYLWVFFRVAALLTTGPFYGSRLMPRRIRLIFAIYLTLILVPVIPIPPAISVLTVDGIFISAQQVLIGIMMGFVIQLSFQPFIVAGQLIAMQTGLGFASLIDPASGASVPLVGQLFLFLCTLVFLSLNVHLEILSGMARSFQTMPIGHGMFSMNHLWMLFGWSKIIFSAAVIVAMPAIFSLLIVNFAFGLMTRAAPQLNIFAIGFPFTLTLGLIIIYLTIPTVAPHISQVMGDAIGIIWAMR